MNTSKYLKYLGALVLLLLVFGSGWWMRDIGAQNEISSLLKDREIELQEIKVVRTENSTLVRALEEAGSKQAELLDLIASLESRPPEIQYITRVETIVVGEPTVVTTELPSEHTFRTEEGLAVAQFLVEGDSNATEYIFDTADLTVGVDIVLGERDSAVSLRMQSDIEPAKELEIPVEDFSVTHIRDEKLFEPHLVVGAGGTVTAGGIPSLQAGPHLAVNWFHPSTKLLGAEFDLVSTRVGFSGGAATLGLDPVLYNIGDRLPVLTNTWIGAGATINTAGEWGGTLTIGAKL